MPDWLELVDTYDCYLQESGVEVRKQSTAVAGAEPSHLRWMLQQMPGMYFRGEIDRFQRWLGFVQGVLAVRGDFAIDELRDHTR